MKENLYYERNLVITAFAAVFFFTLVLAALFFGGAQFGMITSGQEILDLSLRWLGIISLGLIIYYVFKGDCYYAPLAAASLFSVSLVGVIKFYDSCPYFVIGIIFGLTGMLFLASKLKDQGKNTETKIFFCLLFICLLQSSVAYFLVVSL